MAEQRSAGSSEPVPPANATHTHTHTPIDPRAFKHNHNKKGIKWKGPDENTICCPFLACLGKL